METVLLEKKDCSTGFPFGIDSCFGTASALAGASLVGGMGLLIVLGVSGTGEVGLASKVGSTVRLDWKLESEEGGP